MQVFCWFRITQEKTKIFYEKLLGGEEDCPGDELKNGGTERSTLPLSRSSGGSKEIK